MTIDAYKNFITIVESGTILAASQKLLVAQPALSNQLRTIETNYGAKLLNRGSRNIELTEAGKIFYQKAKAICDLDDAAQKEIKNCINGVEGTLRISLPPTNPPSLMHELFDTFIENHPNVNFQIYEALSSNVVQNVLDGISEIGLIRSSTSEHYQLQIYPYKEEKIMAILPPTHPLSKKDIITVSDLQNIPLAVPMGCIPTIEAAFEEINEMPKISISTSSRRTAIEWAHLYNCVALVPVGPNDDDDNYSFVTKDINCDKLRTQTAFVIAKNHTLSKLSKEFLDYQLSLHTL